MHSRNVLLTAVLAALVLAGCSSSVKRDSRVPAADASPFLNRPAVVAVAMSNEGKRKAAENLKFNPEELRETIERALATHDLLANDAETGTAQVEVEITDVRVRTNFSAIAFGFMAGSDHVHGNVTYRDAEGRILSRFQVKTSYALGGLAGMDRARMGWLYEKFAEETLKELTGKDRRPEKDCERTFQGVKCHEVEPAADPKPGKV